MTLPRPPWIRSPDRPGRRSRSTSTSALHTFTTLLSSLPSSPESRIGPYGDAVMELDYRTGQVLDAIKAAGIDDNTIVIWLSDNGSTPTGAPAEFRGGSNLPFRGELGSALEGSLRVPCMVRWPGKIAPRACNEMVSIHDFFPTLAKIIGAKVPDDRPIDGVDQSGFFIGEQPNSNCDSLLTFIGEELVAVRWHEFRLYPKQFVSSTMNMQGHGGFRERRERLSRDLQHRG